MLVLHFWVRCPNCKKQFPCHYQELWTRPEVKLRCPYCTHMFKRAESPEVIA